MNLILQQSAKAYRACKRTDCLHKYCSDGVTINTFTVFSDKLFNEHHDAVYDLRLSRQWL
jgi:hypothetical protein